MDKATKEISLTFHETSDAFFRFHFRIVNDQLVNVSVLLVTDAVIFLGIQIESGHSSAVTTSQLVPIRISSTL